MLEKALTGNRNYWGWIWFLSGLVVLGVASYMHQFDLGLGVTGLSRNVTWGLYIAQFTFLVGVAASAVMVVLPYYLHDYKLFGRLTILGEFLAIAAVTMCMLFVFVDMGQPTRVLNVMLYPTPHSMMFWDMVSLSGYLGLNALISHVTLDAERKGIPPPRWIKPIIVLSIPWAVSIHTVTAFLYSGLAARPFWMTAILAPRFLASAFSAGPALLILFCLILRRLTRFDAGREPIQKLALIVTYAMAINVFFVLMEVFTTLYGNVPEDVEHFRFLFLGLPGNRTLVPWMWASALLSVAALVLLINPRTRHDEKTLAVACVSVFVGLWIEKGLGLIIAGFVPSPFGTVTPYSPTLPEVGIAVGIWAVGALLVTVFYRIALSVRGEVRA
jgi:molybdopterin-containing oxidoreductase family membrane subunit